MKNTKNNTTGGPVFFLSTPWGSFDAQAWPETHEQLVNKLEERLYQGFTNVRLPKWAVTFTYADREFIVKSAWTTRFTIEEGEKKNRDASCMLRTELGGNVALICEEVA